MLLMKEYNHANANGWSLTVLMSLKVGNIDTIAGDIYPIIVITTGMLIMLIMFRNNTC